MLWGERVTRRRVLIGFIVVSRICRRRVAFAALGTDDARSMSQASRSIRSSERSSLTTRDSRSAAMRRAASRLGTSPSGRAPNRLSRRSTSSTEMRTVQRVTGRLIHRSGPLVRYGGSVFRALAEGSPKCWSGYYHGVLERTWSASSHTNRAPSAAAARPLPPRSRARTMTLLDRLSVHPWTRSRSHDQHGPQSPLSLAVCRRLDRRWDRDACKGGVFMENLSASYGVHSRWLRDDPLYPCNAVARGDKRRCLPGWSRRGSCFWSVMTGRGLRDTCARVESDFIAACFQSYGRDASSRNGRNASERVREYLRDCPTERRRGVVHHGSCPRYGRQLRERSSGTSALRTRGGNPAP